MLTPRNKQRADGRRRTTETLERSAAASEFYDGACAAAAAQCRVGYAPTASGQTVLVDGRLYRLADRDWAYIQPTAFSDRHAPHPPPTACRGGAL